MGGNLHIISNCVYGSKNCLLLIINNKFSSSDSFLTIKGIHARRKGTYINKQNISFSSWFIRDLNVSVTRVIVRNLRLLIASLQWIYLSRCIQEFHFSLCITTCYTFLRLPLPFLSRANPAWFATLCCASWAPSLATTHYQ